MTTSSWRQIGVGLVLPAVVVAVWQTVVALGWVNPQVLPSPLAVVEKWLAYLLPLQPYDPAAGSWLHWAVSGELITDSLSSLYRVVVGFLIGGGLEGWFIGLMIAGSLAVGLLALVLERAVDPAANGVVDIHRMEEPDDVRTQ